MYNLTIENAIRKNDRERTKRVFFENCYTSIGFSNEDKYYSLKRERKKDLLILATNLTGKTPDPPLHPHPPKKKTKKQYHELFLRTRDKMIVN